MSLVKYIKRERTAVTLLQEMASAEDEYPLALDLETYAVDGNDASDPFTSAIRTITFKYNNQIFILDMLYLELSRLTSLLSAALERAILIAHNAKFECRFLLFNGVQVSRVWCTMVAEQILQAGQKSYGFGLADLMYEYFGKELDKTVRAEDWSVPKLSKKQLVYAAEDVVLLDNLYFKQVEKMRQQRPTFKVYSNEYLFYDVIPVRHSKVDLETAALEMQLVPLFAKMEARGISINVKKIQEIKERYSQDVKAQLLKIQKLLPKVPLTKSDAAKKKMQLLYPDLVKPPTNNNDFKRALVLAGVELPKVYDNKQKKYRESLSANTYDLVKHPAGPLIKAHNEANSLLTKYLNNMENWRHPKTKRVHYSVRQILNTSRISISDPPLQQMPHEAWFRNLFVPKKGAVLGKIDYSQLELRIMAHISGDRNMIAEYNKGLQADIHTLTARYIFKTGTPTKQQRTDAKPVNFGNLYGQYPAGLQQYLQKEGVIVTLEEAQIFWEQFFIAYPGVKAFHSRIRETVKYCVENQIDYYGYTVAGRKRVWTYDDMMTRKLAGSAISKKTGKPYLFIRPNEMINNPVQGTAGDGIKRSQVRIENKILKEKLPAQAILQVHDELVFELWGEDKENSEILLIFTKIMEQEMQELITKVPIYAEPSIGDAWGSTEPIEVPWRGQ